MTWAAHDPNVCRGCGAIMSDREVIEQDACDACFNRYNDPRYDDPRIAREQFEAEHGRHGSI